MPKTKRAADLHRRPNCPRRAESRQATARRERRQSMPCHVPATSASSRRSRPSLRFRPPVLLATLDLRNPAEREAQDLIRRFCGGRWPAWRVLGMRREGNRLLIAVEWRRCRAQEPYSLVELSLTQPMILWSHAPSVTGALKLLSQPPPAKSARPVPAAVPSSLRRGCRAAG